MIKIFARAGGKDTCWNMKCIKKWNLITAKTKTKTKINFVFHFHSTTVGRFVSHRLGLYRRISFSPFLEYFTFHFLFWLLLSLLHTFFIIILTNIMSFAQITFLSAQVRYLNWVSEQFSLRWWRYIWIPEMLSKLLTN